MIMKPFRFIGRFFADQWSQFTPAGQMLFVFALVAIVVDAGIAYEYGITMSTLHAAGFALVALGLAFLPEEAWKAAERKDFGTAAMLGGLSLFVLLPVAYQTHVGYGAGIRMSDMQQTGFQNATLKAHESALGSEATNLETWREQRARLVSERETAIAAKTWETTATAEGLRAQADAVDKKLAEEIKGKRGRRAGCGAVCEQLGDEKAKLVAQIKGIEKLDGMDAAIAKLDERIQATQRVIDAKTEKVASTGYKSSTVVNQNTALGDLYTLVTGKESPAQIVSLATMGTSSLAFLFMAPAFMIAAGRNRRKTPKTDDTIDPPPSAKAPVTQATTLARVAPVGIPSEPVHIHTTETIKDPIIRRWALTDEVQSLLNGGQLKAA